MDRNQAFFANSAPYGLKYSLLVQNKLNYHDLFNENRCADQDHELTETF